MLTGTGVFAPSPVNCRDLWEDLVEGFENSFVTYIRVESKQLGGCLRRSRGRKCVGIKNKESGVNIVALCGF